MASGRYIQPIDAAQNDLREPGLVINREGRDSEMDMQTCEYSSVIIR